MKRKLVDDKVTAAWDEVYAYKVHTEHPSEMRVPVEYYLWALPVLAICVLALVIFPGS